MMYLLIMVFLLLPQAALTQLQVQPRLGSPAGPVAPSGCVQLNYQGSNFACSQHLYWDEVANKLVVQGTIEALALIGPGGDYDAIFVNGAPVGGANFTDTTATPTTPATVWGVDASAAPNRLTVTTGPASALDAGHMTAEFQEIGGRKRFLEGVISGVGVYYFSRQAELPVCTEAQTWLGIGEGASAGFMSCVDGTLEPLGTRSSLSVICAEDCEHFNATDTSKALKVGTATDYVQIYHNPARQSPEVSAVVNGTRVTAAQVIRRESDWTWRFYDGQICAAMDWATGTLDFQDLKSCGVLTGIQRADFLPQTGSATCTTNSPRIYYDDATDKFKKCENGTTTDMDTTGGGGAVAYQEFTPQATPPTCTAGAPRLYYDDTTDTFKKCENGSVSDLDTTGGGGTQTFELYFQCQNKAADNSMFMTNGGDAECAGGENGSPNTTYVMDFSGNLTNLRCKSETVMGTGTTMTWTVRLNKTTDTVLGCSIAGAATQNCTDGGIVAVVAGDQVTLRNNETGTDNTTGANLWCVIRGEKS
jgi:hypothetical protein